MQHVPRTPIARPSSRRLQGASLLAAAALLSLAGCAGGDDGDTASIPPPPDGDTAERGEEEDLVSLPLLGTRPVPPELTTLTGITWNVGSGHFVVVSDSGQVVTLDSTSFELTGTADSGVASLSDVSSGENGLVAIGSTGEFLAFEIEDDGMPRLAPSTALQLDVEPRGIAIAPASGASLISVDTPDGPVLWAIDGATATEALRLDDATLTRTGSLATLGSRYLVHDVDAPTIAVFDRNGAPEVRLRPEGLASITGVTNRDGTFIITGTDAEGAAVLAAYDLENGEEIDPDPAAGPATLNAMLASSARIALPDALDQPSGIAHDAQSDSVLFSTDQAGFFVLSPELTEIRFEFDIPGFDQGATEDVAAIGSGRAIVVTEEADYVPFDDDGTTWSVGERVVVHAVEEEVSAVGVVPDTDQLAFIPESGPGKSLLITTLTGELVRDVQIDATAVGLENLDDYTVAGIGYLDGVYYVLSERYSTVFTMTPNGVITGAYGLEDAAEASGLAVFDGSLWVVFDHEDSEPTPPVARYPLPPSP